MEFGEDIVQYNIFEAMKHLFETSIRRPFTFSKAHFFMML